MSVSRRVVFLSGFLLAASAAGCGDDGGGSGDTGDDDGGDAGDAGDAGDDGGGDAGDGGDDGSGDGGGGDFACKHLDVVFAIDPSGSMDEEMTAMGSEIFPGFAGALLNISMGLDDYRVGTLDACADPASFNVVGEGPTNAPGDDVQCNFASGTSWIEATPASDPAVVTAEFTCVGDIDRESGPNGITAGNCSGDNDDERPTQAVITALTPPFSVNENAGFLREDAVLVVIAMTDEDEQPIPNASAQELYDQLVAAKGDVKNMVFLGIGGGVPDGCQDTPGTYGTADPSQKLYDLTQLFIAQERGVWWDLCEGQLSDGLAEALQVIEDACDDFVID